MIINKKGRFLVFIAGTISLTAMLIKMPLRSEAQPLVQQTNLPVTGTKAPELQGQPGDWINAGGKTIHLFDKTGKPLAGRIYLVCFWTRGCINCKRVLPYWNDWATRYGKSSDFAVVSVHTPETPGERSPASVKRFAQEKHLNFPILIDNDAKNWDDYGIQAWPTPLLLDESGRVRARWEGELNWDNSGDFKRVEQTIEKLRKEK